MTFILCGCHIKGNTGGVERNCLVIRGSVVRVCPVYMPLYKAFYPQLSLSPGVVNGYRQAFFVFAMCVFVIAEVMIVSTMYIKSMLMCAQLQYIKHKTHYIIEQSNINEPLGMLLFRQQCSYSQLCVSRICWD